MRISPLLGVVAILALSAPAQASAGGSSAPSDTGGTQAGDPVKPKRKRDPDAGRPILRAFHVAPAAVYQHGAPLRVSFRLHARDKEVRVLLDLIPEGARKAAATFDLGRKPTGRPVHWSWSGAESVPEGAYTVRLRAIDSRRRRLRRTAKSAAASAPLAIRSARFPVAGDHDFGGEGARFGADRGDHSHQGQDVMAPEGTPLVAPVAGEVKWRDHQENGAGHYLVIRGRDGRDYVFMHLRDGSQRVGKGDRVRTGQRIAEVGNSGRSSGPHLHFEIWVGGWWEDGGRPIDPLPELRRWDEWS